MFGSLTASQFWRHLLQLLILLGIIAPAWFAGGVREHTLVWILRYFAILCGLILTVPHLRGRLTWLFPILGLGLLLGMFQLLDPAWQLPAKAASLQQPYDLLVTFTEPLRAGSNSVRAFYTGVEFDGPASMDVTATRMDLSILFLYVAACYACARLFAEPKAFSHLCCFLAINGAALSAVALIQKIGPDVKFLANELPVKFPFATFTNRNNGSGYLEICLAGALGWFIYDRHKNAHPSSDSGSNWNIKNQLSSLTSAGGLASATCIMAIIAGIASSLSRGAWLATGLALVLVLIIASTKQIIRGWSAGLVLVVAVVVGIAAAQSEQVQARFASVESGEALTNIRLAHWQDSYQATEPFRTLGSGLGTYRYVCQPQDTLLQDVWFTHAENQYLETLITAGIPGLALLCLAIVISIFTVGALLSKHNLTLGGQAVACAGAFALTTQVVHGGLDFGLYLPSNGLALAALCGGLAGTLGNSENRSFLRHFVLMPRWAAVHPVWCLVLFVGCFAGSFEIAQATKSVALQEKVERRFDERDGTDLKIEQQEVERLVAARPHDTQLKISAARLSSLNYRLRSRDLMASKQPTVELEQLWNKTNPVEMFAVYHRLQPAQQQRLRAGIMSNKNNSTDIKNALSHLGNSIRRAPMDPIAHLRYAKLSYLIGENGQHHVAMARRLAPSNPRIQFQCGLLEYSAGRTPEMLADWQRTLRISVDNLRIITVLSLQIVEPSQFVDSVLPQDPRVLLNIAGQYQRDETFGPVLAKDVLKRIRSTVDEFDLADSERQHLKAQVEKLTGHPEIAAQHFEQAINGDPHKITWHYDYAVLLETLGQFDKALDHARWCVRQAPGNSRYRKLLNRIYTAQLDS